MGIQVEFNPDLALRNFSEYKKGNRLISECLPEKLEVGKEYDFLKKGQRLFWLSDNEDWSGGQVPLYETKGNAVLSRPLASIKIISVTHFLDKTEVWTKGRYKVMEIFNDEKIHFDGLKKIK